MAALDPSNSRIGHGRFRARPSDDCLAGERGKLAQLYRMVELLNPGRISNIMILAGTKNVSRGSDEEEAQWESMMVCQFITL